MLFLLLFSTGTLAWFYVSTYGVFRKFNSLDKTVREKIVLIDRYMYFIRNLTIDELAAMGTIPDKEMIRLNGLHDAGKIANSLKNYTKEHGGTNGN